MKTVFSYLYLLCILGIIRCQDSLVQTNSDVADVPAMPKSEEIADLAAAPKDLAVSEEPAQIPTEQSEAAAAKLAADQAKSANELYHETMQLFEGIMKQEVTYKSLEMLAEGLKKTWLLGHYMKFPKNHNLNDETLFYVLPYLAKVCTGNLLPYYATQPFCVKMKSYYEPVDISFYTTADTELAQLVADFEKTNNLHGFVLDESSQELMLSGLGTSLKNLFGHFKEIDIKKVSNQIANEQNLDLILVERFASFIPISLYAIASILTNEIQADMIAEAVCTHMGYSVYVDNKLSPSSTGQNFWKQVKAFKALSGATVASPALMLTLLVGGSFLL